MFHDLLNLIQFKKNAPTTFQFPQYDSEFMEKYYKAYNYGITLPKGEFFGALNYDHFEEMYGLFQFFYYAKNWEIFQRNVCWARLYANEGIFAQALTLAIMHRDDFKGLVLPAIYEIFPQYFFNSKFIYEAEKFDFDVWSNYIMYEKQYKDFLYKDYAKYFKEYKNHYNYFYTKDWKMWQWWKLMGLAEYWYPEERFIMRDNSHLFLKDSKYADMMKDVKMFYMPVDYTRDIYFYNKESELSYFTEDVEWNAFWYYFNLQYAPFMNSEMFALNKARRGGEYFYFVIRQILARYYLERLSHGFGEIPEFYFFKEIKHGYDPQLISYNGVGYSYRKNYYEFESYGNFEYLYKVLGFFKRIDNILNQGYFVLSDGTKLDMRKPEAIEYLGDIMQGNVESYDKYFATFWYMYAHMYFGNVDHKSDHIYPHVFLNYETMARDPFFYMFYKTITNVFNEFYGHIKPYSYKELYLPGVTIENVQISDLVTYFDLVDFDVTNLLNGKTTFIDGTFVWNQTLLARQGRLNHKNFKFDFTIKSDKHQKVVIRAFLGPKYDEFGRVISLKANRHNFIAIDSFYYELNAGVNHIQRSSKEFYWTADDRLTYTELYKYVMSAYNGDFKYPMDFIESRCRFPDRLIIPKGWAKGMPMQFFFFVYPYTASYESTEDYSYTCSGEYFINNIDEMAFGFPLDREINEYEFFVPNMYFKDVKIYHKDNFDKYYGNKYDKFGAFDYNYYYNY